MSLAKNKVWGGCERRKNNDNALKILIGTAAVVLTIALIII